MVLSILSAAWWATKWTSGLNRAEAIARGPFGGALGVTLAALVLLGALALGLAWLRGDAARDATAEAKATCDSREHTAALAAERAKAEALRRAGQWKDRELAARAEAKDAADKTIATLETEQERLRREAQAKDQAAGRAGSVMFRADDPWVRQGAAAGHRGAAPGR